MEGQIAKTENSLIKFENAFTDIERTFEESGLACCTRAIPLGHRCGYVAVLKEHPLYGKTTEQLKNSEISVDGGITFADGDDDWWVIGWDAAHTWHKRDTSIMDEEFKMYYMRDKRRRNEHGKILVTPQMAEDETRRFAKQVAKMGRELKGE